MASGSGVHRKKVSDFSPTHKPGDWVHIRPGHDLPPDPPARPLRPRTHPHLRRPDLQRPRQTRRRCSAWDDGRRNLKGRGTVSANISESRLPADADTLDSRLRGNDQKTEPDFYLILNFASGRSCSETFKTYVVDDNISPQDLSPFPVLIHELQCNRRA
jgi:hypothetical protein